MTNRYGNKYRISPSRLKDWDYSSSGYYFVTICVKDRMNYLGTNVNGIMELSKIGEIAARRWNDIPRNYPNIELDQFVIMPNHIHGIIIIKNRDTGVNRRDAINRVSTNQNNIKPGGITGDYNPMMGYSLSKIIRWYKGRTAFEIHKLKDEESFQWQSRFFDHIIRDEQSLENIQKYIIDNPLKWIYDSEYKND